MKQTQRAACLKVIHNGRVIALSIVLPSFLCNLFIWPPISILLLHQQTQWEHQQPMGIHQQAMGTHREHISKQQRHSSTASTCHICVPSLVRSVSMPHGLSKTLGLCWHAADACYKTQRIDSSSACNELVGVSETACRGWGAPLRMACA